jgi:hypothetical protein
MANETSSNEAQRLRAENARLRDIIRKAAIEVEDRIHLASLLRMSVADCDEASLRALLSNNLNTIIAALDPGLQVV